MQWCCSVSLQAGIQSLRCCGWTVRETSSLLDLQRQSEVLMDRKDQTLKRRNYRLLKTFKGKRHFYAILSSINYTMYTSDWTVETKTINPLREGFTIPYAS